MANRLAMDKTQAIKSLASTGMSERRIARTLGVSRTAVRQCLGREGAKDSKAPIGEAPTGSPESKETEPPTGSEEVRESAGDVISRGRETLQQQRDNLSAALEAGKQAYRQSVAGGEAPRASEGA